MFGLGFGELIIVLLVVLIFFGGSRLGKLGTSLGEGISNFKKGLKEGEQKSKDDHSKHS